MITLDERTGSALLLRFLPAARIGRLEFGDASFIGRGAGNVPVAVGIERKTLTDLVGSMESGRLSGHQLPGLMSSYGVVYLVVEGISRSQGGGVQALLGGKWRDLGVGDGALDKYLNTMEVLAGVIVRQTTSVQRTAELIHHLYEWWGKDWDSHRGHLAFPDFIPRDRALLVKPSLLRRVAKELPGIGWERSGEVEKHFKSIMDMVLANEEEWRKIPGIGKGIANNIVKTIRGT
jgi:ERCC4-type nuclease